MDEVVQHVKKFAHAYLDDLVIFSDNWEKHLVYLEDMIRKLWQFCLTANMTNC